ncbi:MAG TPA: VWA domain-containing protein [Myxococcaceae bacterium]|nr:VWA domain-containing protein [Myxococcaceae bacterium]
MSGEGLHFTFLGYPAGFAQPSALWLCMGMLAFGVLGVVLALRQRDRLSAWVHPKLAPRLAPGRSTWRPVAKAALSGAGLVLLAFALARPQLGGKEEVLRRRGIDVVVALDASRSMLARDVQPDRMARAKLELETLLDQLKGDRVALVTFSGDAFVQMPLTSDYAAARLFLRAVDPSQMQQGGTDIGGALRLARQVLDEADHGAKERVVVLLTDGEDGRGDAVDAARELSQAGVRVYAVGIGSELGEPIPELDTGGNVRGYHKDAQGNTALTKLDREGLAAIAREGGGELFHQPRGVAMGEVARRIDAMQKSELEDRRVMRYTERYQWFALPGLTLLLAGALLRPTRAPKPAVPSASKPKPRRWPGPAATKATGGLAAALVLVAASPARADLLHAPDAATEEGRKAYDEGRYEDALKAFDEAAKSRPPSAALDFNRGSALYKLGRHEEAKQAFLRAAQGSPGTLEAKDRYNLGNALAQLGQKQEAISAYRKALTLDPTDEHARHNLEVLLRQQTQAKAEQQPKQGGPRQQAENQQGQDQQQEEQNGQGQQQQAENSQGQDQQQQQAQRQPGEDKKDASSGADEAQREQGKSGQAQANVEGDGKKDEKEREGAKGGDEKESRQARAGKEGQEQKSGAGESDDPEPREATAAAAREGTGKPVPLSPRTAHVLDSMRTNERGLQLWKFQKKTRRNDDLEKDW